MAGLVVDNGHKGGRGDTFGEDGGTCVNVCNIFKYSIEALPIPPLHALHFGGKYCTLFSVTCIR